jgi:hypothetical protein
MDYHIYVATSKLMSALINSRYSVQLLKIVSVLMLKINFVLR